MQVRELQRITIPVKAPVRSLCWDGESLIDWVGGARRFCLNGTESGPGIYYPYRFDRALVLPGTEFSILYEACGTKGLILAQGKQLREINRSYYCANAYEYPIACFRLPNGTPAIAHCPDEYNKLEIEEIESARRLTNRTSEAIDFFHSRLQLNPTGDCLISAGWVWQPLDAIQVFRIPDVLQNPAFLDEYCTPDLGKNFGEFHTVAFKSNTSLLCSTDKEHSEPSVPLLVEFDLEKRETVFEQELESIPGMLMPAGAEHVVGFYESPKVFEIRTGTVTLGWPELKTGKQNSSIIHDAPTPPLALDSSNMRFAVADEKQITVVQLGLIE